ncbi:methylmalonyl-CoA carboxyltransferase, partial [bacterium]|nr:methylmalonyl-CoA carboxyltransferase [bacterium]
MPEEDPRILELRSMREKSRQGGGADRIAKQHAKNKLTARERIGLLMDPGTFHETEPFVTMRDDESSPSEKTLGDGVVTGFGDVNGQRVYVYAQDFTVQGGALGEMQSHKICRVMDLAVQSGAPIIGMIDSGGARIQEGVLSLGGYAEIFKRNAQYSGIVPQISLILGPCAGGAVYSPAITDFVLMTKDTSYMFITGPEVIRTVTHEEVTKEALGGALAHNAKSGVAHFAADDEESAIRM